MRIYHYKNCSIVVNNISYIEKEDIQYFMPPTKGYNISVYFCAGIVKQLNFPTKEERDFEFEKLIKVIYETF